MEQKIAANRRTLSLENAARCIQTLESSIELLKRETPHTITYEVFRNAVIKGYELTLETMGKLLGKVLKLYGANPKMVDALFYKDIFRQASKHGLLDGAAVRRWFIYRDNRNNTAHDYGESFASDTLLLLPDFIADARALLKTLQERLDALPDA